MLAIEPVNLGPPDLLPKDYPLLDQPFSCFSNARLGSMADQSVQLAAAESFVGSSQHSKDVAVEGRGHNAEWMSKVHPDTITTIISISKL